jgi:putative FmdB family regulatory protein
MPLYEYQCEACAHRFEVIQKFSDAPVETCPNCGGPVHKLLSSPAIQFKGSGWYITDYARSGKTEGKTDTRPEGKSDGTSDTAAAGKGGKGDKGAEAPSKSSESKASATPSESKPQASTAKSDS